MQLNRYCRLKQLSLILLFVTLGCLSWWPHTPRVTASHNHSNPVALFVGVDVTATGGTLNASYATLQAAFAAINAGTHTGVITLDLTADTTETATAVLNASGTGSASYTSIAIKPVGGAARAISGSLDTPLVDLNGADNVTIDGLNTGGNTLTISNSSATTLASTIRFIGGATSNIIQNTTINGSTTGTAFGTVFFSTDATTVNGNDNNQLTACNLGAAGANPPRNAIYSAGTTSPAAKNNSGITISNCNLYDFYGATQSAGILLGSGTTDWTISGNSFYQTTPRPGLASTVQHGIYVNNTSGNNFSITGNVIGGSSPNAGGSPWRVLVDAANPTATYRFMGIRSNTGTGANSVQGNTVTNFDWKTSVSVVGTLPGSWNGIFVDGGSVSIGTTTGNTIGSGTGTGSVTVSASIASTSFGIASDSGGTLALANNTVGSITTACITASGVASNTFKHSLAGIRVDAGTNTINNNLIGSLSTPNSINLASVTPNTTNSQSFSGITVLSSGTNIISNNAIANVLNNYVGTSTTGVTTGMYIDVGVNTITGNTVRNLSSSAPQLGTDAAASVTGIRLISTSAGQTVAQNTVHSLTNTAATAAVHIYGIYYGGPTTGTNLVARNFVHSLAPAAGNANAVLRGIYANGGVTTYQNNMVRLGLKADGGAITTNNTIEGIIENAGTNNFYHNTVYIGGSGGGGYAINSSVTNQTHSIRNNIFVNARASGLFGFAARYVVNAFPSGLSLSNNIYYSSGTQLIINGATVAPLLQNWQRTESQDAGSAVATPSQINIVNATGDAATVDLHLQSPTAAERAGVNIAGITDDFDGQIRSTLTPVDIGADALNATDIDIFPPAISFTPLAFTGSTINRTLTATITDATGVPTVGALVPRIYYRKGAGTWFSQPGALTSGTATNGTWDFTINNADVSGVVSGNLISYYVIAQDIAAPINLNSQVPGVEASNVNTVTTHPSAPNSYRIRFFGTISVGAGGAYPTLTETGGLIEAINASGLSANTVVNITSNLTVGSSSGNILNQWAEDGAGNYTLLIQPVGVRTILLNSRIQLNGADRVTIDGLNSGGNSFLFRSLSADPALEFINDASNNNVRNCTIEGSTNATGVIRIMPGTVTGNDNITVENNIIRDRSDVVSVPAQLFFAQGSTVSNSNLVVTNNQFSNFTSTAININILHDNCTISGNTIHQTAARTTAVAGITFGGSGTNLITQNVIRDLNSSAVKQGILIGTVSATTTFSRNRIYNFLGTGAMYGIDFTTEVGSTSHVTLVNNQITLTPSTSGNQIIAGIRNNTGNGSAGSMTAYYNSVLIGGTATGTATYAFLIESGAKTPTLRNNILINQRTGGGVAHFALYRASNANNLFSDYNLLVGTGNPTAANFMAQSTTHYDLTAWQGLGFDLHSFASVASGINTNVFTDLANGNLDININGDVPTLDLLARHATPLAVTTDFSNATRHATTPDIGADEFNVLPVVTPLAGPVRVQGNPVSNSSIATATDLEDLETALALAVSSDGATYASSATLNGVTINNLAINASGNVTANIIAGCNATAASFTLRVTDLESGATIATISVTMNVNTPPVLSYSVLQSVVAGCPLIVAPLTGASDNLVVSTVTVHNVTPALTFAPTVSLAGIVTIPAANSGGDHVITIRATDNCGLTTDATFTLHVVTLTMQPAANLSGTTAAPGSVVTTQGRFFTATQQTANALPLPTRLAGVTVNVTDSASVTRAAELFYVTPTSLSFIVPTATAIGAASVAITSASSGVFTEPLQIAAVAPGLFSAESTGQGVMRGYAIRNGTTVEAVARFDQTTRRWVTVPLAAPINQLVLVVQGTGLRGYAALPTATIGSTPVTVLSAAASPMTGGFDELRLQLSAGLPSGTHNLNLIVDGIPANVVTVQIQ
jgi:trimeric autotransporter adhesin